MKINKRAYVVRVVDGGCDHTPNRSSYILFEGQFDYVPSTDSELCIIKHGDRTIEIVADIGIVRSTKHFDEILNIFSLGKRCAAQNPHTV